LRQHGFTLAETQKHAITERVRDLGEVIGVHGLSAHDRRHSCLTIAARNGTDVAALRDMGGWNSPAMALRYVERAKVGNARVNLGDDGED
jgi:integrase